MMSRQFKIRLVLVLGVMASQVQAFDELRLENLEMEKFLAKQKKRKAMLKDISGPPWIDADFFWHKSGRYVAFETSLKEYREVQKKEGQSMSELPKEGGRASYLRSEDRGAIGWVTKLHPEWKKYAEKQMSSEEPIEELKPSLERKILANSWSTLFKNLTSCAYWRQNK